VSLRQGAVMAVLGKRTLSKQPVGVRLGLGPRVLCLVVALHVLKGGVGRVAGDQLGFTARVLAHSVTHRPTAGVPLTSDHKTQPEPNVATEHQEAYQEDEVDGLVVGGGACLLYFDQSGIMDTMIALQSLLSSAWWRSPCCQLLGLEAENSLACPARTHPRAMAVEDVVLGIGVFSARQVKLRNESEPEGHWMLPVVGLRVRRQA